MISLDIVKNIVHDDSLSNSERLLICMGVTEDPQTIKEIIQTLNQVGLNNSLKKNVSQYLKRLNSLVIKVPDGYELTRKGWEQINELTGSEIFSTKNKVAVGLRKYLSGIKDQETKNFVEESIDCFESNHLRAAVVLSWVGSISILYDYIKSNKLKEFNAEARRRDQKWKMAKSKDDLSRMKEFDFLQILVAISVIGKNVKEELEICLKLRNACGHPNSLKIGELRVSSHIETLTLNIFSKFV